MTSTFRQALHGEWTKFRSTRVAVFCLALAAGLTLLFSMLLASGSSIDDPCPCDVDQFRFVHQPLAGDGTIVARVTAQQDTGPWAKAGIMVKQAAAAGSPYAAVLVTPGHGVRMQANFTTDLAGSAGTSPRWLKLTRAGTTITGYESADGTAWTQVGAVTMAGLPPKVEVGLFATSPSTHSRTIRQGGNTSTGPEYAAGTATFDRFAVTPATPAAAGRWIDSQIGEPVSNVDGTVIGGSAAESGGTYTVTAAGDITRIGPGGDNDMIEGMLGGVLFGLIAIVPLGVLFISSEYGRGTIRITFTASPRRGRVLAAKALVLIVPTFVAGLAAAVGAFFLTYPILRGNGYAPPSYSQPSLWNATSMRAVTGAALVMTVVAVFSLGVGALLRRTAAAVTLVIALVVLPRIVGVFLPVDVQLWVDRISPLAGLSILQTRERLDSALPPWPGFAVLCAWALAALVLAWWSLRRRDA